jgi:ribonuclease J
MIPGNEVGILALQNLLAQRNIEIVTASAGHLHVSGHPCRDELIDMYDWVKPRAAIPVHGEARHLYEHAALAKSLGVETALTISNGDMVQLFPGPAEVVDRVINGRVYMDGRILVNADSPAISQRRKLSHIGVVSVAIAIDAANRLCSEPEVNISGIPLSDREGILLSDWVMEAIERVLPENGKLTPERAEKEISQSIRRVMAAKWGKKPIVHVLLLSV